MLTEIETERLLQSRNYTVSIIEVYPNDHETFSHEKHRTVIQPLLKASDEAFVYGINNDSDIYKDANSILERWRGKHRIVDTADPISGFEYLWNATGGKRGTITISVPIEKLKIKQILTNCERCWIFGNYRAGHTPAAINYAKKVIESKENAVFCLPRNNGIQWMDIFAPKAHILNFYEVAKSICKPE